MNTKTLTKQKEKRGSDLPSKAPRGGKDRGNVILVIAICAVLLICAVLFVILLSSPEEPAPETEPVTTEVQEVLPSWIDIQLIDIDGESRRGEKLEAVRDIALHYVANPGTTAQQNRNYYNNPDSTVSSHFLIGLEGEVILCVPLDEKSSATNARNLDTISIELCHPDATGRFNEETRASLVRLLGYLMDRFHLEKDHIIRHYDVTGKLCPIYYVEHPAEFEALKRDAEKARNGGDF